ncbi:MAG TPA: amino acid ABC transporter permease [Stellaceae bacterium]|nr:amino acid ABC transporter permease [Stellaceae bacterium]
MLDRILSELPRFFGPYNLIFLGEALLSTLALSAAGCLVGCLVGFPIALLRRTRGWATLPLRAIATGFVELFRRVPFLVTLLTIFFVSQAVGLSLSTFSVGLVSVCLIASAFISEIVRGGLASVHANQTDAARVLNLSSRQTLVHVVLPQAWKVIIPPIFGFFVLFIKDTALASQVGVLELTYASKVLNSRGFSAVLVFGTILLLYFALSYPLSRLGALLEIRLAVRRSQRD